MTTPEQKLEALESKAQQFMDELFKSSIKSMDDLPPEVKAALAFQLIKIMKE